MYTGHIAQCKLHCKNCTTTVAHICSINKMGRLHRMLILKACPYQQILSSKGTETTNGTTSQHHPYQQICWSTRWVNRPDCSFWPPFDISCHPETTKWVARPICSILCQMNYSTGQNHTTRPFRDGFSHSTGPQSSNPFKAIQPVPSPIVWVWEKRQKATFIACIFFLIASIASDEK